MQVYEVNESAIDDWDISHYPDRYKDYIWVVTDYETGSYCGSGIAIALHNNGQLHEYDLGHCSCYGPTEYWGTGYSVRSTEDVFNSDSVLDPLYSEAMLKQLRELLIEGAVND